MLGLALTISMISVRGHGDTTPGGIASALLLSGDMADDAADGILLEGDMAVGVLLLEGDMA